ncbi:DDE-type integrase/transposase/recombinase [Kaustia mangrovi]|uniref:DDE-type integrase/transposase/recombinase n=1 Tax=Kaustia mangrovi TaxID=2593653 RepID=A0A7S8C844_9HYPH|nr:transposase domain-containing protein [Kaustia mangrovi]QPC44989.1 DDE-type integrase/transposase/recombinase [Kaustia mangrovi]
MPKTKAGVLERMKREGWTAPEREWTRDRPSGVWRKRSARGGGMEFHFSILPPRASAKVVCRCSTDPAPVRTNGPKKAAADLWARWETLSDARRNKALAKLATIRQVHALEAAGIAKELAIDLVCEPQGIASSTYWGWERRIAGASRADWAPLLADQRVGRTATAGCHPQAWNMIKADYLRPEQPAFSACYRRMTEAVAEHGWSPIPSEKTLKRRLEREVPRGARVLARGGRDAASKILPAQTRDRSVFHAMEAINGDGHRFDVFVRWPDGEIERPTMVAFQDLYSGMIVGHRIERSENWPLVRAAFADMMESFGIPEHCYLDNGRAFASKMMTGRMKTRFRFKVKQDEPEGLLTRLGVQVHWTTPYHGQAKPIERAFRDLCEEIAKHPACAGAYTGNKPDAKPANYGSKAIPFESFEALVAKEIARHNTRTGRRTAIARGRSFADVFAQSMAAPDTVVTRAVPQQLRLFLMAAEGVTARKPSGEIHLGGNRYWAEPLVEVAGRKAIGALRHTRSRPMGYFAVEPKPSLRSGFALGAPG